MGRKSGRNREQRGKKKENKGTSASQVKRTLLNFLENHYGEEFSEKHLIKQLQMRLLIFSQITKILK